MGEDLLSPGVNKIDLPKIKPIRLGEYGKALDGLWPEFEKIRKNGIYAGDRNIDYPHFSDKFVFHGFRGRYQRSNRGQLFIPPDLEVIKKVCNIGIISSDIEFENQTPQSFSEEETFGTADFWIPNQTANSLNDALADFRHRLGTEYVTALDESGESATLMFAFDSSIPELEPLLNHSMRDNQPKESLWAAQFGDYYIHFPLSGSGLHLAIPIGLPANYIEYIVVNEKSPHWQGERFNLLRESSKCDDHEIPLVSANTGEVIK